MIAFLPKAYPDELLYSRLSRYHQRSGYVRHISTAEDIYQAGKATHPSIEFVNKYTDDAMAWLTKDVPWETVVEKHTMYPAYIRFLPLCRRKEAVEGVIVQDGNWKNLMHLRASDEKRYLRYCPLCAEEDRETYGETYWHRGHQIPRIRVCHKHGVFLSSSIIPIASKKSFGLFDAQSDVPEATAVRCCENEREIEFARYVIDVFNTPIDLKTDFDIGSYLQSQIPPEYKNKSGLTTDINKFYSDYATFYKGLSTIPRTYMQKIFNGYIYDTYYILQLAFFEGVSVTQITDIPATTSHSDMGGFDSHFSEDIISNII